MLCEMFVKAVRIAKFLSFKPIERWTFERSNYTYWIVRVHFVLFILFSTYCVIFPKYFILKQKSLSSNQLVDQKLNSCNRRIYNILENSIWKRNKPLLIHIFVKLIILKYYVIEKKVRQKSYGGTKSEGKTFTEKEKYEKLKCKRNPHKSREESPKKEKSYGDKNPETGKNLWVTWVL